ncbi:MAG TPA: hypothetical protein VF670_11635 [Duganella sp.]|jgi:hypothetical protein
MNIICIAWGSLLWRPGDLVLSSAWQPGGPELPLEFVRDSDDSDELALVLWPETRLVPTYWAPLKADDLDEAREQLRRREKITPERPEWLGTLIAGRDNDSSAHPNIVRWLASSNADAVVWTAVPPKFNGVNGRAPSISEAIALLSSLEGDARDNAEEYVRRIPVDIMTPYREKFEEVLKWTPLSAPQ